MAQLSSIDPATLPSPANNRNPTSSVGAWFPDTPFTGVPVLGQLWPRSRTTVEEGVLRIISVISSDTIAAAADKRDYVYICAAALTLTMPTAVGNTGVYTVKRTGTGNVIINTTASQTVDGAATMMIDTQYQSVDIVSDGSNWVVV